eukprot:TRINITY_DN10796_c0_g1_i1.p1 TRINITY_DN10796_c0_g1~~TRINITY_DN10796_c0_g1_i1.p1  ORF type:complete len:343 (-),score=37.72 TRINITY_DN10796_c0_g1_i1:26-1054(-)
MKTQIAKLVTGGIILLAGTSLYLYYKFTRPLPVKKSYKKESEHFLLSLKQQQSELFNTKMESLVSSIPKEIIIPNEINEQIFGRVGSVLKIEPVIGDIANYETLTKSLDYELVYPHGTPYKNPVVGDRVVVRNDYIATVEKREGQELTLRREDNNNEVNITMGSVIVPVTVYEENLYFRVILPGTKIRVFLGGWISWLGSLIEFHNFQINGLLHTQEQIISKEKRLMTITLKDTSVIFRSNGNFLGRFVVPRVQKVLEGFVVEIITEPKSEEITVRYLDKVVWHVRARKALVTTKHVFRPVYVSQESFFTDTLLKLNRILNSTKLEVLVPPGGELLSAGFNN